VLSDTFPAEFGTLSWECEASGGAECPAESGSDLHLYATLSTFPANSVITYTVTAIGSDNAIVWNTVTLTPPEGMFDLDMTNNIHSRPSAYRLILPVIYKNADFTTP